MSPRLVLTSGMALLAATLVLHAGAAPSDEAKAMARQHYQNGAEDYEAGRFKDAIDHFLMANQLVPSPALSFNIARAYEKLGDTAGALSFYRDYLRRAPAAEDRAEVQRLVAGLEQRLQSKGVQQVTVISTPEGATVVIDGKPMGVTPWTSELAPGEHQLELRLPGYQDQQQGFNLSATRALEVTVALESSQAAAPAPAASTTPTATPSSVAPPPSDAGPRRGISPWTWVSFGVGVAGLGGALGFELARASAENKSHDARTQVEAKREFDTMQGRQTAARILVGVGAAATVLGGVLLYLDLSSGSAPQVGLGAAPAGCAFGASGRF